MKKEIESSGGESILVKTQTKELTHEANVFAVYHFPLLVSQAFAGTTGKVAGVIKDAKSGEVLPGANVVVLGTRLGATTDPDGNYFILNVPPGLLEVQASNGGIYKGHADRCPRKN